MIRSWRVVVGILLPVLLFSLGDWILNNPDSSGSLPAFTFLALILGWLIWGLFAARLSNLSNHLWIASMAIFFWYACNSSPMVREHDVNGHMFYATFVAQNNAFPSWNLDVETFHPPIYYAVVAPFLKVFMATSVINPYKGVQLLNTCIFGTTMIFFLKIIERTLKVSLHRALAYVFVLAIPSTTIHAGRIGNDPLLFMFWIITLLFCCRWEENSQLPDLLLASLFAAFSCATKGTGLLVVGVVSVTIIAGLVARFERRREILMQSVLAMGILLAGVLFYSWWCRDYIHAGVAGNIGLHTQDQFIQPSLWGSVALEPFSYVTEWAKQSGGLGEKTYFWNHWLKTLMVGAWSHEQPGTFQIMRILATLSLLFIPLFVAAMYFYFLEERVAQDASLIATTLLSPLFNLLFWWQARVYGCADARYVFPFVVGVAILFFRAMENPFLIKRKLLRLAALTVYGALVVSGAGFQIAMFRDLTSHPLPTSTRR